jgi:hypothetical protein
LKKSAVDKSNTFPVWASGIYAMNAREIKQHLSQTGKDAHFRCTCNCFIFMTAQISNNLGN